MGAVGTFELCCDRSRGHRSFLDGTVGRRPDARRWLPAACDFLGDCISFGGSTVLPAFVDEDCSRLFRSLGRMCVLDVHVGQTDAAREMTPGGIYRPRRCRRATGELSLSLLVPLMGKSSRRTDVPTGSPVDDHRRSLPPSPMSSGRRGNVVVPLGPSDGKIVTTEWSYGNGTAMNFPPDGCCPR